MEPKPTPNTAYESMMKEAPARRRRAYKLRQQGKSLKEIGIALGVTRERARQLVAAAIKELNNGGGD